MMKISKYILLALLPLAPLAPAIQAAEAPANAAEISVSDTPKVKVAANSVDIEIPGTASRHVDIIALTGQVVKQFDAQPGLNTVDLPAGYYIVRIERFSVKIAVK